MFKTQAVEGEDFRGMVSALSDNACVPNREELLIMMRKIRRKLLAKIKVLLRGEHVTITTDKWISICGDEYVSVSISLITKSWNRVSLVLDCAKIPAEKYPGIPDADDSLAERVQALLQTFALKGRIFACVTDCDQAMADVGISLQAGGVCPHLVCCARQLEKWAKLVLEGKGVKEVIRLARELVARYSQSRKAAGRLRQIVAGREGGNLDSTASVIQDVSGKWWSSYAMVERLVQLQPAIRQHEEKEEGLKLILEEGGWKILELILPILEPFVTTRGMLQKEAFATGGLVLPLVFDLRGDLDAAMLDLEAVVAVHAGSVTGGAATVVMQCLEAMVSDFRAQWGDGSADVLEGIDGGGGKRYVSGAVEGGVGVDAGGVEGRGSGEREGVSISPGRFKAAQVLATALDPRTKMLYGVDEAEHEGVWSLVTNEAIKAAKDAKGEEEEEKEEGGRGEEGVTPAAAGVLPSPPGSTGVGQELLAVGRRRRKRNSFMAFAQSTQSAAAQDAGEAEEGGRSARDKLIDHSVRLEVDMFRASPKIKMYELEGGRNTKVFCDPLSWWKKEGARLPHLSRLARRVLAVPGVKAPSYCPFSERILSYPTFSEPPFSEKPPFSGVARGSGIVAGEEDEELNVSTHPENIELFCFLRGAWKAVEEWDASAKEEAGSGGGQGRGRGKGKGRAGGKL